MRDRLLIVDDEESILFAMRRYFAGRSFDVDCAYELAQAQGLLASARYAAMIADLRLTGVHGSEGLELAEYVHEHCPWTRIVLLTAYGSPGLEAEARRRGVDAVLRKPQPLPDLAQTVMSLLAVRR